MVLGAERLETEGKMLRGLKRLVFDVVAEGLRLRRFGLEA